MQEGKSRQRETVKEKPGRKADGTDVQRTGEDTEIERKKAGSKNREVLGVMEGVLVLRL